MNEMDEKVDTTDFPREPWQRLLADADDGPPETTDARVRAAARRDLAPRGRRWWLPASLAASLVLAVFVVQSQFGSWRVPVASETDGAGGTLHARIIDREEAEVARPAGQAPAATGKRPAPTRKSAEADDYGYPDAELAADSAGTGPVVGGPEHELRAASEIPGEAGADEAPPALMDLPPSPASSPASAGDRDLENIVVTGNRRRDESADRAQADAAAEAQSATTKIRPPPFEKTPETWYAYIERLRAQGKHEEADRQLARLEKAHPGWVERYLRDRGGP
jgi:hypothetical protein